VLVDIGVGLYMCWLIQVSDNTCVGLYRWRIIHVLVDTGVGIYRCWFIQVSDYNVLVYTGVGLYMCWLI
jgi:hypothetical protein